MLAHMKEREKIGGGRREVNGMYVLYVRTACKVGATNERGRERKGQKGNNRGSQMGKIRIYKRRSQGRVEGIMLGVGVISEEVDSKG